MSRYLARRLVLAAGASLATSRTLAQPARRVTLRITHAFINIHLPMIRSLAERFTAKNPDIAIETQQGGDNWDTLLDATLRSGLIDDLPDVSHQSLTYTRLLQRRGFAQPIDGLFHDSGGVDALALSASMVDVCRHEGQLYALPVSTTLPVLYANADLLARAGEPAEGLGDDWPGVIRSARRVAALRDRSIGGYLEYTAPNTWMFQNILASLGGSLVDAGETKVMFDRPEGLEALRTIQAFGTAGSTDLTQEQARQAFNAGAMGILMRSASGIPSVQTAAQGKFALRISLPPVPSAQGRLVGAGNGVVMFTRNLRKRQAAWKWMRFVTEPESQATIARATGYMPVNLVAVQDPAFLGDYYRDNPLQQTLVGKLPITSDWYSFSNQPKRIFDMMTNEIRRVLTGQVQPEAALAAMAEQTRQMMRQA